MSVSPFSLAKELVISHSTHPWKTTPAGCSYSEAEHDISLGNVCVRTLPHFELHGEPSATRTAEAIEVRQLIAAIEVLIRSFMVIYFNFLFGFVSRADTWAGGSLGKSVV